MNEKPVVKNVIIKCGCDMILPLACVYILYIILHGHLSPGGGFQGGVLIVALVALICLGHGYQKTIETFSYHLLHTTEGYASIFYVALGFLGVAMGAHFAENVLYRQGAIGSLYSAGTIFWMNFAVGVKVITGVGSISLLMLSVLRDTGKGEE